MGDEFIEAIDEKYELKKMLEDADNAVAIESGEKEEIF